LWSVLKHLHQKLAQVEKVKKLAYVSFQNQLALIFHILAHRGEKLKI